MAGQVGVEQGLAVVMVAIAAYCAARLALPALRGASAHRDADLVHAVMALAMAAMLVGVAKPVWGGPLVLLFAVPAVWFAVRSIRWVRQSTSASTDSTPGALGHVQLSIAGVAMVYMSGVVPGFGSASIAEGTAPSTAPELHHSMPMPMAAGATGSGEVDFAVAGAVILLALAAFAFVNLGELAASADRGSASVAGRMWPWRLTLCCQLVMGATMAHMIAAMV